MIFEENLEEGAVLSRTMTHVTTANEAVDPELQDASKALQLLSADLGSGGVVDDDVDHRTPFVDDRVLPPRVRHNRLNVPLPINSSGSLPDLGQLTPADKVRLNAFYRCTDYSTYLLRKNPFIDKNKFYITVEETQTLGVQKFVNDSILHFAWKQFSEQHASLSHGTLRVAFFPSFFFTRLLDEGHTRRYRYNPVSKWSRRILGDRLSVLDYDLIVFLRHKSLHWWIYVMFPKKKHLEGIDCFGVNGNFDADIKYLWRWLNDDLHFHSGLEEPLNRKDWVFNCGRSPGMPRQQNGWDCGLYAIHLGFAFGIQAPLLEITKERVQLYRQKLILYMLDGDCTRDILLPSYHWYEEVKLESWVFSNECDRLYQAGVPNYLVDVRGDGNCLYYCMLNFFVQSGFLKDEWKQ